jgi:hypothetical protein
MSGPLKATVRFLLISALFLMGLASAVSASAETVTVNGADDIYAAGQSALLGINNGTAPSTVSLQLRPHFAPVSFPSYSP